MKCDELKIANLFEFEKVLKGNSNKLFYSKFKVDEAIAELKEALKIKNDLLIENGAEIGSLKADNESLRKAVSNWHDKYCNLQETIDRLECKLECVKANKYKELRDTKRALWLARAERAKWESLYFWYAVSNKYKSRKFDEVERKCRAKAEEFK